MRLGTSHDLVPKPTPIGPDLYRPGSALTALAGIRLVNWIYAGVSTLLFALHTLEALGSNPTAPMCR